MPDKFGGRKYLVALLAILSASVLCWYGKVEQGVYAQVVIATVGAYMAANVIQKRGGDEKKTPNNP